MIGSLITGYLVGWLHLAGLKLTLARLPRSNSPRGLVAGSRLARTTVTLVLFYVFCLPCLPAALFGWWVARNWAVKTWS